LSSAKLAGTNVMLQAECDQHTATSDQAQFRQATIAGGQKREKSGGGGRGGQ
jgi:hypothetical protein